jgi:hypothetical protein
MVNINPELRNRLASWRRVTGVIAHHPEFLGTSGEASAHFLSQSGQLRSLLLLVIQELDLTYAEVDAYFAHGERSALHEQYLQERTAYALRVYEQAVAEALHMANRNFLHDLPREREVIRNVYMQQPRPKSWFQRIFGG